MKMHLGATQYCIKATYNPVNAVRSSVRDFCLHDWCSRALTYLGRMLRWQPEMHLSCVSAAGFSEPSLPGEKKQHR